MYDFPIFTVIDSSLHGFTMNQHNDKFPVGLLALLMSINSNNAITTTFQLNGLYLHYDNRQRLSV